tara:strand:- start:780 stop:1166 length:387 start_codon:yes stop_codon:yes gene_type:complete
MSSIAPKLPFIVSRSSTPMNTKTIQENTQQNLKNLILTSPGERVMDLDFGVGLRNYLFDNNTAVVRAQLESRIFEQVDKYMPFVNIIDLQVVENLNHPNSLEIKLRYNIQNIASEEILSVSLDPKLNI